MLSKQWVRIGLHVIGWLSFISLMVSFLYNSPQGRISLNSLISTQALLFFGFYLFLFYINVYGLMPHIYLKEKYGLYFGMVLLLFLSVLFLKPFEHLLHHTHEQPMTPALDMRPSGPPRSTAHPDIISIVLFVMVCLLSSGIPILKQWRNTERRAAQAEADKAHAELSFLKAQINPHFLFNTLNNIYSLSVTKNEKASDAILKLSNIMRYVTDEVTQDFVPLEWEVDCISNYIALQQLRLNDKVQLNYTVEGKLEGKEIAPLLLMTFIENVFKYGISNHEPCTITIQLKATEKNISFFCQNKIFAAANVPERKGIGLDNNQKRLLHLYPEQHKLDMNTDNGIFTVQLHLNV